MSNSNTPSANPMMLSLFRNEVETHTATLIRILNSGSNDLDSKTYENISQALQSIRSASNIVKIDIAADLTSAIEKYFANIQSGKQKLNSNTTDKLLACISTLQAISASANPETLDELNTHSIKSTELILSLNIDASNTPSSQPAAAGNTETETGHAKLGDDKMLKLFRTEIESHTATLNRELLLLEEDPTRTKEIESLMRASHSIKGAARIVNIDTAVTLAHAMEDLFVAVQKGNLTIDAGKVDLLFSCTDMLSAIGQLASTETASELYALSDDAQLLSELLEREKIGGETATAPRPLSRKLPDKTGRLDSIRQQAEYAKNQSVRVSSENMSNLMNLAGEIMIRGRRIHYFENTFRKAERMISSFNVSARDLHRVMQNTNSPHHERMGQLSRQYSDLHNDMTHMLVSLSEFAFGLETLSTRMHQEAIESRMRPFSDGTAGFPRMVRDISKSLGKEVSLEISGAKTKVDRDILEKLEPPITHLLRNAVDHGIEFGPARKAAGKPSCGKIILEAAHNAGQLLIKVKDDGCGIDIDQLRRLVVTKNLTDAETAAKLSDYELLQFMFLPGFTTVDKVTELSGRGVGLDIVHDMIKDVGGSVHISTERNKGTTVRLLLPITLSVVRSLVFKLDNEAYALSLTEIDCCVDLAGKDIILKDGIEYMTLRGDKLIPIVDAKRVLRLSNERSRDDNIRLAVIGSGTNYLGLIVDAFIGEYDLVVRPMNPQLGTTPCISCCAIMENGSPVLMLDVADMTNVGLNTTTNVSGSFRPHSNTITAGKRILVVEDSETVRAKERSLFESNGYSVDIAVDGMDGWNALTTGDYDMVVTDVDMPRMSGIDLVSRMRKDSRFEKIPVIIVSYKDRQEDRDLGLQAGADYYMTKNSFNDDSIIKTIKKLLGDNQK